MESINPQVNSIHAAYCQATAFEVPMLPVFERLWWEALRNGLTADDIRLVAKDRLKRIAAGVRHKECLLLRNFIGSEESIGEVIVEAAAVRAAMRVKAFCPGKAEALRATGRDDQPEQGRAIPIAEVIRAMKESVG